MERKKERNRKKKEIKKRKKTQRKRQKGSDREGEKEIDFWDAVCSWPCLSGLTTKVSNTFLSTNSPPPFLCLSFPNVPSLFRPPCLHIFNTTQNICTHSFPLDLSFLLFSIFSLSRSLAPQRAAVDDRIGEGEGSVAPLMQRITGRETREEKKRFLC